jgi:glycosyltransferase involved in cell wall biosynthesis
MGAEQLLRWDRGVDTSRFDPSLRDPSLLPRGKVNVLYSGRITREKGVDLLADAFLQARAWALAGSLPGALPGVEDRPGAGDWPGDRAPGLSALDRGIDLHLVLAGGGPEQERLAGRLGEHATFLGWLSGEELARAYASADLFLFPSSTDTFGQVILEAQASGLPVIAVAEGGPLSLIEDRVTGLLCEASAPALADALLELACSPLLCGSLSRGALASVRERTWERALARLGEGYRQVVSPGAKSQAGAVARAA